jgi:hypothetical protein
VHQLMPCWTGYLFCLSPFGVERNQLVTLFSLLANLVLLHNGTAHYEEVLCEFRKVCVDIMDTSTAFSGAYPPEKHAAFLGSLAVREKRHFPNLLTVLDLVLAKDFAQPHHIPYTVQSLLMGRAYLSVFWEAMKRDVMSKYGGSKVEAHLICQNLLYGDKEVLSLLKRRGLAVRANSALISEEVKQLKAEEAFASYFWDSQLGAPELPLPEGLADEKHEAAALAVASLEDVKRIVLSLMPQPPVFLGKFFRNLRVTAPEVRLTEALPGDMQESLDAEAGKAAIEHLLQLPLSDPEMARRQLLLDYFYFNEYPGVQDAVEENISQIAHQKFSADAENRFKDSKLKLREHAIARAMALCNDVSAFGGMLRVYCPARSNATFNCTLDMLIQREDAEKLRCLLENEVEQLTGQAD